MKLLHAHVHYVSNVYVKYWRDLIKALRGVDNTKYALSTIIYKKQSSENVQVQNTVILSKNIFSASNFFMHIFNMPVTCMQNIERDPM